LAAGQRGQQQYSQLNMPHTSFTCRDKILGGYYADAETNCQMFHICVKVAGVGVSKQTASLATWMLSTEEEMTKQTCCIIEIFFFC
jgi:hypothetical protein